MLGHRNAHYFVEVQDNLLTNRTWQQEDSNLSQFNEHLLNIDQSVNQKIGLCFMGRQAPGANNIVDGLLRYQASRTGVELIGFINGVSGIMAEDFITMTRESFKLHYNLGGIDYIGRGPDSLRTKA